MFDVIVSADINYPEDLVYTLNSIIKDMRGNHSLTVVGVSTESIDAALIKAAEQIKTPGKDTLTERALLVYNAYNELIRFFNTYTVNIMEDGASTLSAFLNKAIKPGSEPWIVLMDAGTVMQEQWTAALHGFFHKTASTVKAPIVGVSGRLVQLTSNKVISAGIEAGPSLESPLPVYRGMEEVYNSNAYKAWLECSYLPKEFMVISRDAFRQVKGFDPNYKVAMFDLHLSDKLASVGKMFYEPDLMVRVRNNSITRMHSFLRHLPGAATAAYTQAYKEDLYRYLGVPMPVTRNATSTKEKR